MDNSVPNHKAIMEALLIPFKNDLSKNQTISYQSNDQQSQKDKHLDHCLIIDSCSLHPSFNGVCSNENVRKELEKIMIPDGPKKEIILSLDASKTESISIKKSTSDEKVEVPSTVPENMENTDSDQQKLNQEVYGNMEVEKILQNYIEFILNDTDTHCASSGEFFIFFAGLRYLAHVLKDTKVTSLNLGWNKIGHELIIHFAETLPKSNLISLILRGNRISNYDKIVLNNAFRDTELSLLDLVEDPVWDPLCYLNYFRGAPRDLDLDYIVECQNHPEITELDLRHRKKVMDDGPDFLSPILKNSQIKQLDLSINCLKCNHLKLFSPSLVDTKITHLNLGHNNLGYEGIKYLASDLKNTQITNLNLRFNSLTCNSLRNLVLCLPETKITALDLSGNDICCNAFYLASVLKNTQISDLDLSNKKVGTFGNKNFLHFIKSWTATDNSISLNGKEVCSFVLYDVSNNLKRTNVTYLELSDISINNDDLRYLCHGLVGSKVASLDLRKNNINCKGVQHLLDVLKQTRISKLNLSNNRISCDGVKYLLEGLQQDCPVRSLDLSSNPIGNGGIEYLAQHLHHTRIVELKLCMNKIDCNGAQYLAQALKQTTISKLDLAQNEISSKGLKYLVESLEASQLASLNLSHNPLETKDIEYLARNLEHSKIVELFLDGFEFSCESAHQLCDIVVNCSRKNSIKIHIDFAEDVLTDETVNSSGNDLPPPNESLQVNEDIFEEDLWDADDYDNHVEEEVPSNESALKDDEDNVPSNKPDFLIRIPGYHLEINQTLNIRKIDHLIKKVYQKSGITKLIIRISLDHSKFTGTFNDISINELCMIDDFSLESRTVSLFEKSNIAEFMFQYKRFFVQDDLDLFEHVSQLKAISLNLKNIKPSHLPALKPALMRGVIKYLDLSDNELGDKEFEMLTNILADSKIISLNLSGNSLGVRSIELLAQVLPRTKITYIDLHQNNLGYSGFKCLMSVVDRTEVVNRTEVLA